MKKIVKPAATTSAAVPKVEKSAKPVAKKVDVVVKKSAVVAVVPVSPVKPKATKVVAPAKPVMPPPVAAPAKAAKATKVAKPVAPVAKPKAVVRAAAPAPAAAVAPSVAAPLVVAAPLIPQAEAKAPVLSTTIVAAVNVGFGNVLTLRGEGAGLNWDAGVPLLCAAEDRWSITLPASIEPVVFKLLINDSVWSAGENFSVLPGASIVLSPIF